VIDINSDKWSDSTALWRSLDRIVSSNELVINRPAGSSHPDFPDSIYPLDYGYIEYTAASDDSGIDVWVGSLRDRTIQGFICIINSDKK
jgi:inorganic pyrophosphatase